MNDRHAYLIIAHRNDGLLHTLLQMIDDPRNDIYLHMDKKFGLYNTDALNDIVKQSKLYLLKRKSVYWGDFSLVSCELNLFEYAIKNGPYDYYHLLSGQDLPIKTQDAIHEFFLNNYGREFVGFYNNSFLHQERVSYYYLFPSIARNGIEGISKYCISFLSRGITMIQRLLGVKRHRSVSFQKGTQWVSVTHSFACDLLSSQKEIKRIFRFSFCGDELYKQTFIINHPQYIEKLYHSEFDDNMIAHQRFIDWDRGDPYIWRFSDKETLLSSDLLFARKFDPGVDNQIIEYLKKYILGV